MQYDIRIFQVNIGIGYKIYTNIKKSMYLKIVNL